MISNQSEGRKVLQREFWNRMRKLLGEVGTNLQLGDTDNGAWMNCRSSVRQNKVRVTLHSPANQYRITGNLDGRRKAKSYSKNWHDYMMSNRADIEARFGLPIDTKFQFGDAEVQIGKTFTMPPLKDQEQWNMLILTMHQRLQLCLDAFEPHMQAFAENEGYLLHNGCIRKWC